MYIEQPSKKHLVIFTTEESRAKSTTSHKVFDAPDEYHARRQALSFLARDPHMHAPRVVAVYESLV